MLCVSGVGIKEYFSGSRDWLSTLRCPDPGCFRSRFWRHGSYVRYLGGVLRRILRVRCSGCGVTHGVVPEQVCAYRDLTLDCLEQIWDQVGPSSGAREVFAAEASWSAAVCRMRRLLHRVRDRVWPSLRGFLPALIEPGLAGLRELFGSSPGVLVRLRHWLLSSHGLWFSGLCGLWRHGRPRHSDRR